MTMIVFLSFFPEVVDIEKELQVLFELLRYGKPDKMLERLQYLPLFTGQGFLVV